MSGCALETKTFGYRAQVSRYGTTAEKAELDFAVDQTVEKATRIISHCGRTGARARSLRIGRLQKIP